MKIVLTTTVLYITVNLTLQMYEVLKIYGQHYAGPTTDSNRAAMIIMTRCTMRYIQLARITQWVDSPTYWS